MDPQLLALCRKYGVFLRREALAFGYHDQTIAKLVRTGHWVRVRHGAYTFGEIWQKADNAERYRLRVRAVMRQAQTEVVASHISAVAMHNGPLWGLDLRNAHLTRIDGRTGRKEAGVQQHRGTIAAGDVVEIGAHKVMSPTRAVLEVTTLAGVDAGVCVADHFLNRGATTLEQLRDRYERMVRWPATLQTDLVLRLANPRSESVGETLARQLCFREGLPKPELQVEIFDENGTMIGRVDMAWPEHGVFLEFDGREKYLKHRRPGESIEDAVLREKRREDLICQLTGWRCIRITWADLERPGVVAQRIRNLMFARRA